MKKEEPKTDFKFSYAALEQLGDKGVDLIDRDSAELLAYGVDAAYRTALVTKTEAVKNYPTDEELLGVATEATELKDTAADVLKVGIRSLMVRVKQVFPFGSAKYKRFGTSGLDDMNDNDLVRCGRRVSRMATQYLADLAPKGVDAAMITDLDGLTTDLDDAIDAQDAAIRARNAGTQERVELANDLYALVVELFDFGKDYWYTRSEAKYNDYIIYDVPGGGATPPAMVVEGTVAAGTTEVVLDGLDPDATVTMENTGTVAFTVCGADNDTADPCMEGETLEAGEEITSVGDSAGGNPLPPYLKITNNDATTEASYRISVA